MNRKKVIEIAQEKGVRVYSNQETSMKKGGLNSELFSEAQYQTREFYLSIPGFSTQSPMLSVPVYTNIKIHTN